MTARVARVALIGATGHGGWHLRSIAGLQAEGMVDLVGISDVREVPDVPAGVPFFADHAKLLADVGPDVVVVCTPPHTHLPIATDVLRAGADLLLEKPPVLDLAQHDALTAVLAETGRTCQVGFQALGSAALPRLLSAISSGDLGTVTSIGARGAWFRDEVYFRRTAWAGRASVDGRPSLDGALANPFAHAVMQVLAIASATCDPESPGSLVRRVSVERYRTRDIEVDDTASVRLVFASGATALIAVSLCAEEFVAGDITVTGSAGTAVLEYPTDRLRLPGQPALVEVPGRVGLLANLLEHRRDPAIPLIAPLARTRAFTALLPSILAVPPLLIPSAYLEVRDDLPAARLAITGVNEAITRAATEQLLFSELDLPWSRPA